MTSRWGNRSFVLLFSAQVVSLTGSGVTTVGLALFAWQLTGGPSAAAVVGNALMLRILAFLLFSQPAGVLADRWDRRKMLERFPTCTGILAVPALDRVFVSTAGDGHVVALDGKTDAVLARLPAGRFPDGIGFEAG